MAKKNVVKTKRLVITCMAENEIRQLIAGTGDEELHKAYEEMLAGALKDEKTFKWYAPWKICRKEDGAMVGDLCFKGEPKEHAVEIGYGLVDGFEGNGYMTEAVKAMKDWVFGCGEEVYYLEAETAPDNAKSQKILEGIGFTLDGQGEEGPRFVIEAPPSMLLSVGISLGMCFGVSFGLIFDNLAIGMCMGMAIGVGVGASLDKKEKEKREAAKVAREDKKNLKM